MFEVNPLLGRIHMKNQALICSEDKRFKCRLLPFLFGTLRVNVNLQFLLGYKTEFLSLEKIENI